MPKMRTICLAFFLLLITLSNQPLLAQPGNPAQGDSISLQKQFDEMLRVSNRFQAFKVVKQDFLNAFIVNVNDSISAYTGEIRALKKTIATQDQRINEQAGTIEAKDVEIGALNEEKDGVNLLGIALSKTTYSLIMWSAIIGLLALLLMALARMRVAVSASNESGALNAKLTDELEKARKRRLEVEQNLRRELQDEINKRGK